MGVVCLAYSGSYRSVEEKKTAEDKPEQHFHTKPVKPQEGIPPQFSFQSILKKIEAAGLETDDLLLALVLFLMYRESGDKDLLILLGAMLLS